jgi:hypothetical protein
MKLSKQQKQILLLFIGAGRREKAIHLRLREIITEIERAVHGSSPRHHSNVKMASFSRSLQNLKKKGLMENTGLYWRPTDAGFRKALEIKREMIRYIEIADEFRNLVV